MEGVLAIIVSLGCVMVLVAACVMAVRVRRTWGTTMMVVGSVFSCFGLTVAAVGIVQIQRYLSGGMMGGGSSWIDVEAYERMLSVGGWVLLLGILIFVGGFAGFVGSWRALVRRAEDLQGMVEGLQERMEGER